TVLPSPRLQNAAVTSFGSPGGHHATLFGGHPGQMQLQYGVINQNPQFPGYRGGFGGPQYMQPPNGGNGGAPLVPLPPYIVPPFMQGAMPQGMYTPHQMHSYTGQPSGPPPLPASGGYPSPGRGAPMMMHQGSQQGHNAPVPAPMMMSMSSGPTGHP